MTGVGRNPARRGLESDAVTARNLGGATVVLAVLGIGLAVVTVLASLVTA